mmetsp:Transcript_3107/g.4846  ORF Transcript_3107/g.4846 Transcript_3107/m.4846 type:complete len:201 (-) Transcript_3107:33-635(-)
MPDLMRTEARRCSWPSSRAIGPWSHGLWRRLELTWKWSTMAATMLWTMLLPATYIIQRNLRFCLMDHRLRWTSARTSRAMVCSTPGSGLPWRRMSTDFGSFLRTARTSMSAAAISTRTHWRRRLTTVATGPPSSSWSKAVCLASRRTGSTPRPKRATALPASRASSGSEGSVFQNSQNSKSAHCTHEIQCVSCCLFFSAV